MTISDFLFCGGDIDKIDLTSPVVDSSSRLRGLFLAWAIESICERRAAAGINDSIRNYFRREITADQLNQMLASLKLLCPEDTSLKGDHVFRFVRDDMPLFGQNDVIDLGEGRFQDSWEASQLYGHEISQYVSGSPFYSSSFIVQAENNVFGGSAYRQYVKNTNRGDRLEYLPLIYTYSEPLGRRLQFYVRHFNSSNLNRIHENPIYNVYAGGVIGSGGRGVISKKKTTLSSRDYYDFENNYRRPGSGCERWHVFRASAETVDWDTQRRDKSYTRDFMVRSDLTSGAVVDGSELNASIGRGFSALGIGDDDITAPTQEQVDSWHVPAGAPLPYTLTSNLYVSYIGCYIVYNLRDRTITPWRLQ